MKISTYEKYLPDAAKTVRKNIGGKSIDLHAQ